MTNAHKDALFVLVKSLSKSEKRQFKLYVGRLGVNTDAKFLALFNLLDKMRKYDERQILDSGIVKKSQLSNQFRSAYNNENQMEHLPNY